MLGRAKRHRILYNPLVRLRVGVHRQRIDKYILTGNSSFQEVEGLSALDSSIRFIPHPIVGAATNIATAYLISRVKVQTLAVVSGIVTLVAPVLMATIDVGENYWFAPFWVLLLSPVNPDGTRPPSLPPSLPKPKTSHYETSGNTQQKRFGY